jgi:hypothetical protein
VTANVKDFGAKLALYEALMEAGISVVLLRPSPKARALTPEAQMAALVTHSLRIGAELRAATEPILIRLTLTELRVRTLREVREQVLDL